ncbi:L-selectin-like isoform X2 [Betta splendens]|uniref:L-selectin-like isoform X2 n=1 Tax=Betta splendens TaxID=158456 RepID=A0A9W2XX99_BETSP|nr:L-selectin-like isoform X2 [Betta splendens]
MFHTEYLCLQVFGNLLEDNTKRKMCVGFTLLLLLPLVCGQVVNLRTNMFTHYSNMVTWRYAQAYCREYHTDLVTIVSEADNQKVLITQGWIGLYREDSNSTWKWSRGTQIANFFSWNTAEPAANNNCAFKFNNTLKWQTDGCNVPHTFNCYDETLLVTVNKTWEEALHYCRALEVVNPSNPATDDNNFFDLATVITQHDYTNTRQKILDATTDEVWMGLRYLAGQWLWAGGENAQFKSIQNCSGPMIRTLVLFEFS